MSLLSGWSVTAYRHGPGPELQSSWARSRLALRAGQRNQSAHLHLSRGEAARPVASGGQKRGPGRVWVFVSGAQACRDSTDSGGCGQLIRQECLRARSQPEHGAFSYCSGCGNLGPAKGRGAPELVWVPQAMPGPSTSVTSMSSLAPGFLLVCALVLKADAPPAARLPAPHPHRTPCLRPR